MWCWLYRWRIWRALDEPGPKLDHRLAGHLKTCDGCRRFHQAHRQLIDRLGRSDTGSVDRLDPARRERILREVVARRPSESNQRPERLAGHSRRPLPAAAAILLCLSGGLLLWQWTLRTHPAGPGKEPTIQGSKNTVSPDPLAAGPWFQGDPVGRRADLSWSGVLDQPILAELEHLKADTRSAMDFLLSYVAIDRDRAQKRNI